MMAIQDFFRRLLQKPKQLPMPEEQMQKKEAEKPRNRLGIFAEQESGSTKQIIKIEIDGILTPIAEIKEGEHRGSLKDISSAITRTLETIRLNSTSFHTHSQKRADAKLRLDSIGKIYGLTYTEDLERIIESCLPSKGIDYSLLNHRIPKVTDINHMENSEIEDIGKLLEKRLKILEGIKTPEQAGENVQDIVTFMESQEVEDPFGILIAANIDSINEGDTQHKLDLSTIIACAQRVHSMDNEDTIMYSAYLKLEEKRILKRMRDDIQAFGAEHPEEERTEEILGYLDEMGMSGLEDDDITNVLDYMIQIRTEKGIKGYVEGAVKKDIRIKRFINENDIPNSFSMLQYLNSRMASFGQVTKPAERTAPRRVIALRDFIEQTEYKDPDNHESQEFLLMMAGLEKDYIDRNYSAILERYHTMLKYQNPARQEADKDELTQEEK